ncbi:unnamed protein product, partial [Choristocarpus tenellus]
VRSERLFEILRRVTPVVKWLHEISTISDGTCRLVCEMLDVQTLGVLMEADAKLPKDLTCALHDLYLTLMADQPLKTRVAAAYVRALPAVTADYAQGVGAVDFRQGHNKGLYTLSVQFLNRSAFVKELVEKHHLLQILSGCLLSMLMPAYKWPPLLG